MRPHACDDCFRSRQQWGGGNAFDVLKKSLETTSAANYLGINAVHRTDKTVAGETKIERIFARARYMIPERGKEHLEILYWDENSRIISHYLAKDGYYYDAIARTREVNQNTKPVEDMLTVMLHSDFKDGPGNLSMKETQDGYELRFSVPTPYDSTSCVIHVNGDYLMESIRRTHRYAVGEFSTKITERYDFRANELFSISFPPALTVTGL